MRADRLLSIMLLLQVHRSITARELARKLEVSERTIYRDMEALSAAGIPVVAERGTGGGWALLEEYRTNLTGLNEAEIQALFVSRPPRLLADLGLHQAAEAALIKLLAALPVMSRRGAEYARQRIYVDAAGWHATEENAAFLPIVQDAVWQDRKLYFVYQRGDNVFVERLVDPLGLVAKGSAWYLVAAVEGEVRSYRISRIRDARVMDELCVRPAGFDLEAYWRQSAADFVAHLPRFPVVVRIIPDALPMLYRAGRNVQVVRNEQAEMVDADGRMTIHLLFQMEEEACGYLLSFGTQVEIVEPVELREKVRQLAESVAAFYNQQSQTGIPCHSMEERAYG